MESAVPLDPDRTLALSYIPKARKPAVQALWRLDAALGAVLGRGQDPLLKQIRLTWWRDALMRLDEAPPPGEPVLQAVADAVLPLGVSGATLAEMEPGWEALLAQQGLAPEEMQLYARNRGGILFAASAALLGLEGGVEVEAAGEAWALVDLARRTGNERERSAALRMARARLADVRGYRWPAPLRPLGMLAVLAARDAAADPDRLEPQGSPGRMLRMIRHRLTGR